MQDNNEWVTLVYIEILSKHDTDTRVGNYFVSFGTLLNLQLVISDFVKFNDLDLVKIK